MIQIIPPVVFAYLTINGRSSYDGRFTATEMTTEQAICGLASTMMQWLLITCDFTQPIIESNDPLLNEEVLLFKPP